MDDAGYAAAPPRGAAPGTRGLPFEFPPGSIHASDDVALPKVRLARTGGPRLD